MRWTRREFMTLLGAEATLAAFPNLAFPAKSSQERSFNVLFIVVRGLLGYGDLQCYGHSHIQTPYLDLLAQEGLRFSHCYLPSPLSYPAQFGALTGRTPCRTGVGSGTPERPHGYLDRRERTLANILKEYGYDTFGAGEWYPSGGSSAVEYSQPHDHGFDHWLYTGGFTKPSRRSGRHDGRNGKIQGKRRERVAKIVVDEAIQWLDGRAFGRPFFQYINLHGLHSNAGSPGRSERTYGEFAIDSLNSTNHGPDEYYANVTYLDHQVGRLLMEIDRQGIRQDTFVFFTSDNHPASDVLHHRRTVDPEEGAGVLHGQKVNLFEGGIRVPGIARLPGRVNAGSVSDIPVSWCDLLPTVCQLTGAPLPLDRPIDGEDFSPIFGGRAIDRKQPLYWQFSTHTIPQLKDFSFPGQYALRDGDLKLIIDGGTGKFELFNLREDPTESRNLANREPGELSRLIYQLRIINQSIRNESLIT